MSDVRLGLISANTLPYVLYLISDSAEPKESDTVQRIVPGEAAITKTPAPEARSNGKSDAFQKLSANDLIVQSVTVQHVSTIYSNIKDQPSQVLLDCRGVKLR